jgi:hypothetical protein
MTEELDNAIHDNAAGPAEVSVDGQRVKQHDIEDQIAADRYAASKAASRKKLGIRLTKVIPPGAG